MDEARARVEAEAEKPDLARRRLEGNGIVVRHGDVEGRPVEVLGAGCAANCAVVLGAAVGRAHDQRLAQSVAQRLQLFECRFVDEQVPVPRQAISAGEKLGQRQVLSGTSRNGGGRSWSWGPPK